MEFDTRAVGIEVKASYGDAPPNISEENMKADILFAIATPRNYNHLIQTWSTL